MVKTRITKAAVKPDESPLSLAAGSLDCVWDIETEPLPIEELRDQIPPLEHPGVFDPSSVKCGNMGPDKAKAKIAEAERAHAELVANFDLALAAHEHKFLSKAALSPLTGRVRAIGYLSSLGVRIGAWDGGLKPKDWHRSEGDVLQGFWDQWVTIGCGAGGRMIGHSIASFDLPFVARRSWFLGVPVPPDVFDSRGYAHRTFLDLMDRYRCGNRADYISLGELSVRLGGPAKNGDGAMFGEIWQSDRKQALDYLTNDLAMTLHCARRMGVLQ
jgi:hypothetical protein